MYAVMVFIAAALFGRVKNKAVTADEYSWDDFHADSYSEALEEFDRLYASLTTKRSKNGTHLMVYRAGETKFARSIRL